MERMKEIPRRVEVIEENRGRERRDSGGIESLTGRGFWAWLNRGVRALS